MQSTQTKTRIEQLSEFGQSIWFDNISRSIIDSGELNSLIEIGISGVTSNPTIFDKAITGSDDYTDKIKELKSKGLSTFEIYDELTVEDICDTADLFRPVFEQTQGRDGYVSLEVNPLSAHKIKETIQEAKRLHRKVNRANVLFKIPATENGLEAAKTLLTEGINVNFTLLFSLKQYMQVANTFLEAANEFHKRGGDLRNICSVASIFVSRIDTAVDKIVDDNLKNQKDRAGIKILQSKRGKAAVANSGLIFAKFLEIFSEEKFLELNSKGLKPQRPLWASTSTKNPEYSDIKYVTELIGKSTINTIPRPTIDAFLDHGIIEEALSPDITKAEEIVTSLRSFGIDIEEVCAELLKQGVVAFQDSFNSLLRTIELR